MMDNAGTHAGSLYAGGGALGSESYLRNNFTVREGTYRNVYEYAKTNHGQAQVASLHPVSGIPAALSQLSIPVHISVASVKQTTPEERFPLRLVFNIGREIYVHVCKSIWAPPELNRPLDKQLYKGPPTCHDLNPRTASLQSLSLLTGFVSGCVIYSDPVRRDITRLFNEDRIVDNTKVTCVKWLPAGGNDHLFMAAHASGNVFVYNSQLPWVSTAPPYSELRRGAGYSVHACKAANTRNPQAKWTLEGGINDMAFSPCGKYLAFARRDGLLQVFEWATYELIGASRSYFGGLLCCAWSHDSKFVAAAGEDDLVHVWSLEHYRIIARCRGHRSWVSRVAWDACNSYNYDDFTADDQITGGGDAEKLRQQRIRNRLNSNISARQLSAEDYAGMSSLSLASPAAPARLVYRFASVGQDTQLCVWELTEDVINQVLFPSKARNSFVIPASSEMLKRGGRRFAFRATAGGTAMTATATSGGSGSSSLASSTRSSAVAANTDVAAAAAGAASPVDVPTAAAAAPLLIQSGRRFRFPLGFMRRSSPSSRNNKSTTKSVDVETITNADSTRENDSCSTLQGMDTDNNGKSTQKHNEIGSPSSNTAASDSPALAKRSDVKSKRNVPPPVVRSTSASERRRQSERPATVSTDNDDNDDADVDVRSDCDDGPLHLMSDGEILEHHRNGGASSSKHRSVKGRAAGGALSVDSNTASLPSHGATTDAATGKKKKRRHFSLMRFGRGNAAVAAADGDKKQSEPNNSIETGSESSRRGGRRVAASFFGGSTSTANSTHTTITTATTDMLGGFAAALAASNKNRFLTPECPRLDDVPMLEPVMCKSIATERLSDIVFLDECMLVATQDGTVQVWGRPEFLAIAQQQQSNHGRRLDSISSRHSTSRTAALASRTKAAGSSANGAAAVKNGSRTSSYGSDGDYRLSRAATTTASGSQAAVSTTRSTHVPNSSTGSSRAHPTPSHNAMLDDEDNDDLVEAARYGQTATNYQGASHFPPTAVAQSSSSQYLSNGIGSNHVGADEDDELIDLDAAGNRTVGSRNGRYVATNTDLNKSSEFMPTTASDAQASNGNVSSSSSALSRIAVRPKINIEHSKTLSGSSSSRDSQSTLINTFAGGDGNDIDDRDINGDEKVPVRNARTNTFSPSDAAPSSRQRQANAVLKPGVNGDAPRQLVVSANDLAGISTSNYSIRFGGTKPVINSKTNDSNTAVRIAAADAASPPGLATANSAVSEVLRRVK